MRSTFLAACAVAVLLFGVSPALSWQSTTEETGWTYPEQRRSEERVGPRAILDQCKAAADAAYRTVACYVRTISTVASAVVNALRAFVVTLITFAFRLVVTVVTAILGLLMAALFG